MKLLVPNLKTPGRRGAVVMMVLVCLVVVSLLILATVHTSLQQHRHVRNEIQMEQTKWLLDAGIRRAIAQVKQQPNYEGESIRVAGGLKNADQATVDISLVRMTELSQVQMTVVARLGSNGALISATQRSIVFDLPSQTQAQ